MRRIYSKLKTFDVQNKVVLLRIDGNVPLEAGNIKDDFRLNKMNPTLSYLVHQKACIIILTHIGNPKDTSDALSTKVLLPWFRQKGYETIFCPSIQALNITAKKAGTILLFENTRFFREEKNLDITFAQQLSSMADFYIFDAFGALHRDETTISLLPLQFEQQKRTIGFLVEQEYNLLVSHLNLKPSVLIAGGGKPEKKIDVVRACANYIDTILLCPLLSTVNTPLPKNVMLPVDYVVYRKEHTEKTLKTINASNLLTTDTCISIGEKTLQFYEEYIKNAKLIIWNGVMGFFDQEETLQSSKQLAEIITHYKNYSIIAGGDTTAFIRKYHLQKATSLLITGGGATLAIIARQDLPGLDIFLE